MLSDGLHPPDDDDDDNDDDNDDDDSLSFPDEFRRRTFIVTGSVIAKEDEFRRLKYKDH